MRFHATFVQYPVWMPRVAAPVSCAAAGLSPRSRGVDSHEQALVSAVPSGGLCTIDLDDPELWRCKGNPFH